MDQTASMIKAENKRLMQERDALRVDFEECSSELYKRMPANQITDSSIQKEFARLRLSIDVFVFEVMKDEVADDALFKLCQKEQKSQKQKTGRLRTPLSKIIQHADISAWGPYECSNLYILSVIIQWILDEFIFGKSYPVGITDEQIQVIEEVEEGMDKSMIHASQTESELVAPINLISLSNREVAEQSKIDIWRSETLTALTTLREYDIRLESASRRICNDLNGLLSPWLLEAGPFAKIEGSFRQEILDPAIKLHQDLSSSSYRYDTSLIPVNGRLSPKQMLEEWELKNADTWQTPRSENRIGKALYCLHPPIYRLRSGGRPPIAIAKAVMVVASPGKGKSLNPQGNKGSPQRATTAPSAAMGSSIATSHTISPLKQESPARKLADSPSVSTGKDSPTASRSTQHSSNQKKTLNGKNDLPRDSKGTSKASAAKVAARQPSRRESRDTSKDASSPRSSASESSQPPLDPSTPGPSKPSAKRRSSKTWNPLRIPR